MGADGILGVDTLRSQRILFDFHADTMSIVPSATPDFDREPGSIVVRASRKNGRLVMTHATANGRRVSVVLDTGSEITIGNTALRDQLIRRYPDKFETIEITGVTGVTTKLHLARIPELRLGSVRLQNVPIAFADVTPFEVCGISDRPSLLLGSDLMETFRKVSLDFRARKVRFQLRKCDGQAVRINTMPTSATRISTAVQDVCAR
jgi:predicted aspartyl protease